MLNNSPYDLAAAVLCLEEAGAVVTDAYGEPLGPIARCSARATSSRSSCCAAANAELHAAVCAGRAGVERARKFA